MIFTCFVAMLNELYAPPDVIAYGGQWHTLPFYLTISDVK